MKILFIHAHLIIDEYNEFLDGALLVDDKRIMKVFPHTSKIKDDLEDIKIIDIKGNILRPAYFDTHYIKPSKGVINYLYNIENEILSIDDKECLGYYIDTNINYQLPDNIINNIKGITLTINNDNDFSNNIIENNNIKRLLGKSNIDYQDININYDGIRNIFFDMKELNSHIPSLANAAFIDDKYVEFNIDIHDSILRLLLNNISKDKLILIANNKTIHESVLKLKDLKMNNNDILALSSLNAYRLYNLDNHYGSLRKGKFADLLIMNHNYEILFTYKKGEFIYE